MVVVEEEEGKEASQCLISARFGWDRARSRSPRLSSPTSGSQEIPSQTYTVRPLFLHPPPPSVALDNGRNAGVRPLNPRTANPNQTGNMVGHIIDGSCIDPLGMQIEDGTYSVDDDKYLLTSMGPRVARAWRDFEPVKEEEEEREFKRRLDVAIANSIHEQVLIS